MANGNMPKTLFDKIPPAVANPKIRYQEFCFLAFKKLNIARVTKNANGISTMALRDESIKIPGKIKIREETKAIQESLYK